MKIQVVVFWVVMVCGVAVGYQRFGGSCFLHLQDLGMKALELRKRM